MPFTFRRCAPRSRPSGALLATLGGAVLTAVAASLADEPPKSPQPPPEPPGAEVRLDSGRVVSYRVPFNRNSLKSSARRDNHLIALTSSGALLRFDLPEVRLVRERVGAATATCLGQGENGALLAGLGDGRICKVDPLTLELQEVARIEAPPSWIGWWPGAAGHPKGLVVVARATRPLDRDGRHWDVPYSVAHDIATGKTFELEQAATAFLLDRAGRLWLGADRGEWGGSVWRADLVKGTLDQLKPPPSDDPDQGKPFWQGVYGFIERRDGAIWAYGGVSHMGFNEADIVRIDTAEPRRLFTAERAEHEAEPGRPELPITHIIEENGGGLLAFSYDDVFRVDAELKAWKRGATLEISYRWGRPDAVGSYPAVQAVHPPSRPGEPCVLATIDDGYVLLDGTKAVSRALPGQLGAVGVSSMANSSEGLLLFDQHSELPAWKLGAKGWETADFAPPFEIDPGNDAPEFENELKEWPETQILVGPGGAIFTVNGTGTIPGTRTTARWEHGKAVVMGRETSSLQPSSSFITADGVLWNADLDHLKRFEKGQWRSVADVPDRRRIFQVAPLRAGGPPWFLLGGSGESFWKLSHGPRGERPVLKNIELSTGGKKPRVLAGIAWNDGKLLLATDHGLRLFDPATSGLSNFAVKGGPSHHYVSAMVRDGLGRLWLGGREGLWLVEAGPNGMVAEPFDRVPGIGKNEVEALEPDPRHEDGAIVALGENGVAFVRAPKQKPSR